MAIGFADLDGGVAELISYFFKYKLYNLKIDADFMDFTVQLLKGIMEFIFFTSRKNQDFTDLESESVLIKLISDSTFK